MSDSPPHMAGSAYHIVGTISIDLAVKPPAGAGGGGTAYDAVVIADGPVSYWPLNEPSGTVAHDVVGSNPGTYTGGITLGQAGIGDGGTAALLDGAAGTRITVPSLTTLPSPITLEVWGAPTAGPYCGLLTKCTGNSPTPYDWRVNGGPGAGQLCSTGTVITGVVLTAVGWNHFVWTNDGTTGRLYLNGAADANAPQTLSANDAAKSLVIGNRDDGVEPFTGRLAKAAIYNKILTPAQISAHYAAG